jgi:hypothetical protein
MTGVGAAARRIESYTRKFNGRNAQFLGFVSAYLTEPVVRLLCVGIDLSKVHSSLSIMHFDGPGFVSGGSPILASFGTDVDKSLRKKLRGAFLYGVSTWITHYLEDARSRAVADVKSLAAVVCIENYALGRPEGAYDFGEIGGVVRNAVYAWHKKTKIPVFAFTVSPSTLKLFATGNGAADKLTMTKVARENSGTGITDNNEADAFHLSDFAACCVAAVVPDGGGVHHSRIGQFLINHGADRWRFV